VAAGAIAFEDGLKLVYARAMAMQKACELTPSTMAAVLGLEDAKVEEVCENFEGVVPANYNCPGQLVISGPIDTIKDACKAMKEAGLDTPVMIAGATTSPLHTALKIAPEYQGVVVHVKDVSQNVVVASELLGDDVRSQSFVQKLRDEQKVLRDKALEKKAAPLRSLDEARANKLELFK
jgi:[acyl-carrier-protein] S-malonyltransferase